MIFRGGKWVTSYSQLDKYLQCPHNWYLKYIEKPKIEEQRSLSLEYGLAVHETLEFYFENKKNGIDIPKDVLKVVYDCRFTRHDIPFESYGQEMEYYLNGQILIDKLYDSTSAIYQLLDGAKILGVELPFNYKVHLEGFEYTYIWTDKDGIEQSEQRDYIEIIGFIDLVIRTKDGIILIDHKTSKKEFDEDKLKKDLQFPIYAMVCQEMFGELPYDCAYIFTRLQKVQSLRNRKDKRLKPKEPILMKPDLLQNRKEIIVGVFEKMYFKDKHTCKPTPLCYWCDYGRYKAKHCKSSSWWKPKPKE